MAAKQPLPRPVFATEGKGGRGQRDKVCSTTFSIGSFPGSVVWSLVEAGHVNKLPHYGRVGGGRWKVAWDSTKVWEEDKSKSTEKASLVFPYSIIVLRFNYLGREHL